MSKLNDLNQRIAQVRKYKQLTQKEFSIVIEVSQGYLSAVETNKHKPSIEILTGIANQYKDINPGWLLTGHGDMITPPPPKAVPATPNFVKRSIHDNQCTVNDIETDDNVNERIKRILKDRGLTLKEFSRESQISYSTLQEYMLKNRIPGGGMLIKISAQLNVSIDWLLTGKELPPYTPPKPKHLDEIDENLQKLDPQQQQDILSQTYRLLKQGLFERAIKRMEQRGLTWEQALDRIEKLDALEKSIQVMEKSLDNLEKTATSAVNHKKSPKAL